jgi:hypothetical protein
MLEEAAEEQLEEAEVVEVVRTYQVEYQVTANGVLSVNIKRLRVGFLIH